MKQIFQANNNSVCRARKLRLEYPGAIYYVSNRGNYRVHIFATDGRRSPSGGSSD